MRAALFCLAAAIAVSVPAAAPSGPGWALVWSDEFDGSAVDPDKWTLANDCWGGGNDERQCYTDRADNAAVKGGLLLITAKRERFTGAAYPVDQRGGPDKQGQVTRAFTPARLETKAKAACRYGRFTAAPTLRQGQGRWPAA